MNRSKFIFFTAQLVLMTFSSQCFAILINTETFANVKKGQAEYFNSNQDQRSTLKIHLLNGVQSPGIYRIPDNASLLEAVALAGGIIPTADLEKVHVRRNQGGELKTLHFNLKDLVKDNKQAVPMLANNDVILIEAQTPTPPPSLIVIGTIVSIITSGLLAYLTIKTIQK